MTVPSVPSVPQHVIGLGIAGEHYRLAGVPPMSWDAAQALWRELVQAQDAGLLYRLEGARSDAVSLRLAARVDRSGHEWLAVRSADDPAWAKVPTVRLVVADPRQRGSAEIEGPARRAIRRLGLTSSAGGWLRRIVPGEAADAGPAIHQGLRTYVLHHAAPGYVFALPGPDGTLRGRRWYSGRPVAGSSWAA